VLSNLGLALHALGRLGEALECFDRALVLKPDYADAHNNRGVVLAALLRFDEALASYDRAIALSPAYAGALNNRSAALVSVGRHEEALQCCDQALALRRDSPEVLANRANALAGLQRFEEALASCDRAMALQPASALTHSSRATILLALTRLAEALASSDRAIALNPDLAEAFANRGAILRSLGRYDEARASSERAIALKPDLPLVLGNWLHEKMHCCDWAGLDAAYERVIAAIERDQNAVDPFVTLATPLTPRQQQRCARTFSRSKYPASASPLWRGERYAHDRIRIGYFSSDFGNHPVAHLLAGVIELHDRARFEVVACSFGPTSSDAYHQRLKGAFDRFLDVRAESDRAIAARARELEIDIAVDLNGYTEHERTGIFAHRPCPVQVNYLGYIATMGAPYIDYVIGDRVAIPEGDRPFFDEKVVYLPHSYQANDSKKRISGRAYSRAELGLPESGFVFCCFNNAYKITPEVFDIWARLLKRVDGSVLWLSEGTAAARQNLRLEAERRGVSPDRLVFAPRVDLSEYLARSRQADLFLDTFHYNAGTMASDALWSGLPVLTCLGRTFAGRMAASLLGAMGLPELIATSPEDYESLALDLATHPDRHAAIRQRLSDNRTTQPLFDTARFTRHLEQAFVKMQERRDAGLPPDHFAIAD
jgi:protein O-GlcNAc transferase